MHWLRLAGVALGSLLAATAGQPAPEKTAPVAARPTLASAQRDWSGRIGPVRIQRGGSADPRGVVLLLSGQLREAGRLDAIAHALVAARFLVARIDTPALLRALDAQKGRCNNPNYALVDLARDVQHRARLASYRKPVVIGYGVGATLAYVGVAQWHNSGYLGAISIDPAPTLASRKGWCGSPGFAAMRARPPATGWRFGPDPRITMPWILVRDGANPGVGAAFVARVPGARLIHTPGDALPDRVAQAAQSLLPHGPSIGAGATPLPDMPLTIVPAAPGARSDMMAIAWSGDGGWVGIDQGIAQELAAAGVPVVGVDSLSYFWSARTPQGAGRDLARLIQAMGERLHKRRVMLVGYSFGADVLPHMIATLDPDTRARIASVSLLGFGTTADFQFHLTSWLDMGSSTALPTLPAAAKLRGLTVRCVRGDKETDSACPAIAPGVAQLYVVPGGHHFDRNTALLAQIALGRRNPGVVAR
jgi:type IV secretory pathway VirJ component